MSLKNQDHPQGDQDDEERRYFAKIVQSFKFYRVNATNRIAKELASFKTLVKPHQKRYLTDFEDNCQKMLTCVEQNNAVLNLMTEDAFLIFFGLDESAAEMAAKTVVAIPHYDHDRVCTTLKQIVRDWSSEGADERAECYTPIVNELITLFPHVKTKMHDQEGAGAASSSSTATEKTRVLVPGAGLARLAFEIAKLGFECQGCEFSYHMLIASHFILNKCPVANGFTIHPYVNAWCNNMSSGDQSRAITFPDESPMQFLNETDSFSMCAGDFLDIYNTSSGGEDEARWDCVITCYFVDTAHNVVDYVEKIWQLLKPNGLWINYGPLLYHFSEQPGEASIELSYEQLRVVIDRVGFEILKEEVRKPSRYLDNKRSMLKYVYDCVFFTARKGRQEDTTASL